MKNINIVIEKDDVCRDAELAAAYAGARGGDITDFERVTATAADRRLLTRYWNECAGRLVTAVRPVLETLVRGENSLRMTLALSHSVSDPMADEIESGCRSFLTAAVSARWFETVRRDEAGGARAFAEAEMTSLMEKIFHRRPPHRART